MENPAPPNNFVLDSNSQTDGSFPPGLSSTRSNPRVVETENRRDYQIEFILLERVLP